jgi:hypothetical protein
MKKKEATSMDHELGRRMPKPLFEFEGRYEEEMKQANYFDENINQAIELRYNK